jgi:hypothetical protein
LINEFVPVKRDDFKKSIVINKVNQYHLNWFIWEKISVEQALIPDNKGKITPITL